jgi:hypothetical protein
MPRVRFVFWLGLALGLVLSLCLGLVLGLVVGQGFGLWICIHFGYV